MCIVYIYIIHISVYVCTAHKYIESHAHHTILDEDSFADHGKLEGLFLGHKLCLDHKRAGMWWTFVQPLTESNSPSEYVWQAPFWVVYHASGRQLLRWTSLCLTFQHCWPFFPITAAKVYQISGFNASLSSKSALLGKCCWAFVTLQSLVAGGMDLWSGSESLTMWFTWLACLTMHIHVGNPCHIHI